MTRAIYASLCPILLWIGMAALSTNAHAASYHYTSGGFDLCHDGSCPAYVEADFINASFTFDEPLPLFSSNTYAGPSDVTMWSISDELGYFSFSSSDADAAGELGILQVAAFPNGSIEHYLISVTTFPCVSGCNAIGLLGPINGEEQIVFHYNEPDGWDAGFDAGQWNENTPEPPAIALTLGGAILIYALRRRRIIPSPR